MHYTLLLSVAMLISVQLISADIYLHNPRGSNNRLDEANRQRTNAKRLFDSQNNNRGGYNVGGMYYYVGSVLTIEWTNQHSCNNDNSHCEIILQYMCEDNVRDGASTTTIPDDPLECADNNCNRDLQYGMHENYDYYILCRLRQRNKGLFLANQRPNGNGARFTRQNRRGTRNGYECPEERDYYPYWAVSPWKDIAILTNNQDRCMSYQNNSFNNNPRYFCKVPNSYIRENLRKDGPLPINQEECETHETGTVNDNTTYGVWTLAPPRNLPAPDCLKTPFSRDNHLGNGIQLRGFANTYNWTIPNFVHEHCALRIRYNISTQDYEAWDDIDSANNSRNQRSDERGSGVDIGQIVGLEREEAERRGYTYENNPEVDIFDYFTGNKDKKDFNLRLAINTAQFGRTFQDRSHAFAIRPRPEGIEGRILNLNVRGKRGNIVQVYPGVEYDFVPNRLYASINDYIHIQWTGSNTNPNNNDGQGKRGTDRSNIVLLMGPGHNNVSLPQSSLDGTQYGWWSRNYPELLNENDNFLGMAKDLADNLAKLTPGQFRGEMSELDDAGTYYDLPLYKITKIGTYYYLCTRNNNFTNRSQKGAIIVTLEQVAMIIAGISGGVLQTESATVTVPAGAYTDTNGMIQIIRWTEPQAMSVVNGPTPSNSDRLSEFVQLSLSENSNSPVSLTLMLNQPSTGYSTTLYRAGADTNYELIPVIGSFEENTVTANTNDDGIYVAYGLRTGVIVGSVVGVVLIVLLLIAILFIIYFSIYPKYLKNGYNRMKTSFTFASRSVSSKV